MKKIKYLLISLLVLIPLLVNAKGSISISEDNLVVQRGKRVTFSIEADNLAGVVEIVSSDSSIATVSMENYFFDTSENINKVTIIVTGIKKGNAKISVLFKDVATFDYEELTGVKTVNVSVIPNDYKKEDLVITKFTIEGYSIPFNQNQKEYEIEVQDKVETLIFYIEGDNLKVNPKDVVNIANKDHVTIDIANEYTSVEYVINIKRVSKTDETIRKLLIIVGAIIVMLIIAHRLRKEKSQ